MHQEILRRRQRLLPWMLSVAALLLPLTARPQPVGDPLVEAREARYWLARIHEATSQRSFLGTFVVSTGGSVASARIAHYCDGTNQFERIEPLDGRRRQVLRHNDVVTSLWPQQRLAVIETRQSMSQFPALLSAGAGRIVERYRVQPLGEGRVAGHEAHVLLLSPKDGYRYGYRLWAEKGTGLLLRAEVLDEREAVLEASAFSDLIIGVKPQPDLVLKAMKRLDGYRIERPMLEPTELQAEGWTLRDLPPGFEPVSTVRRSMAAAEAAAAVAPVLQSIYSDGLTYVSIFIEPFAPAVHKREASMAMGATQTMTRRQGEWWLTVIGDVPTATLRAFALGLERRR
ncbi:MAG TPA: MucB/RseB C-terminal domain-containing protein [Methylibium sp.]|nr:MucB/RseB C-terminal domain-containing protein [Methylibium sp.]